MADNGFCVYVSVWDNKLAMQRLLGFLRQSQNYCTEIECTGVPRIPGSHDANSSTTDFILTCILLILIAVMYAVTPRSIRKLKTENAQNPDNGPDASGDPPAPAATN